MTSITMERRPDAEARRLGERRVYVHWYGRTRWTYLHAEWHMTYTRRYDGRDRYFWLALGPLDIRWHVYPRVCRSCGIRITHSLASVLCPTCAIRPKGGQ